jgi:hypothetical protein
MFGLSIHSFWSPRNFHEAKISMDTAESDEGAGFGEVWVSDEAVDAAVGGRRPRLRAMTRGQF